jgi:hypothetical protein
MTIEITPEQHGIIVDALNNRIERLYRDSEAYRDGGNKVAQMDCLDEKKRVEKTLEYIKSAYKPIVIDKEELVALIRAVDPDCTYEDDAGQHVTTEWLVGTFSGRGFVAPTLDAALSEMCEYLGQHIGHDSLVGDIVTKSGWPDLKKVKEYLKERK